MAAVVPNPNEAWRNYAKRVDVDACRLRAEDLKRLYRLINEKQIEVGTNAVAQLWKTDNETPAEFEQRRKKVADAFITTVQIKGPSSEVVTGYGEQFFDSGLITGPETADRLRRIL